MIIISNLYKSFKNKNVIDNLNLSIENGEITALIGKNGAGKSTLIRLISGLLKPDKGNIIISQKEKIGVLLGGDVNLYANLTAYEIIQYFGKLHNLTNLEINKRIDELNEILDFKEFIQKQAHTFSRGMKQKIAFVTAIIHNPDILLLDEPSTGLDIETSNDVINFIKYLKSENKTILIATHNIFEISDLSDSISFLNNGSILQKIKTSDFFHDCNNQNKSKKIIDAMGYENEKNFVNS